MSTARRRSRSSLQSPAAFLPEPLPRPALASLCTPLARRHTTSRRTCFKAPRRPRHELHRAPAAPRRWFSRLSTHAHSEAEDLCYVRTFTGFVALMFLKLYLSSLHAFIRLDFVTFCCDLPSPHFHGAQAHSFVCIMCFSQIVLCYP